MIIVIYLIIFILIVLYLSLTLYIKLTYKFWAYQPVFHFYNIFYWFKSPDVIDKNYPLVNKYCNFKNIKTFNFNDLTALDLQYIVNFLRLNFLRSKQANYLPTLESFSTNFLNNNPSYISIYSDNKILFDSSNNYNFDFREILGVMTGKPLNVKLNTNKNIKKVFPVYYIDYLCVHKNYRKEGLAPEIIQTHEWYQRHNSNIKVSLFKREGKLTGIVPLTSYNTYAYKKIKISRLIDPDLNVVLITPQTAHILLDFIKIMNNKFYCIITPNISNFLDMIKNKILYIYVLRNNNDIIATYFFKNTHTVYKMNNKEINAIECIGSISNCPYDNIFYNGFTICYYYLCKNLKSKLLLIENISDNKLLINSLNNTNEYFAESPTAYFFYNYVHPSIISDKILVIY